MAGGSAANRPVPRHQCPRSATGKATAPSTPSLPPTTDKLFYLLYLQTSCLVEAEFERDVRLRMRKLLSRASGDAGSRRSGDGTPNPFGMKSRTDGPLAFLSHPLPLLGAESDLTIYVEAFMRNGFQQPVNYYRDADQNGELSACLVGLEVTVPALCPYGERDPVIDKPE